MKRARGPRILIALLVGAVFFRLVERAVFTRAAIHRRIASARRAVCHPASRAGRSAARAGCLDGGRGDCATTRQSRRARTISQKPCCSRDGACGLLQSSRGGFRRSRSHHWLAEMDRLGDGAADWPRAGCGGGGARWRGEDEGLRDGAQWHPHGGADVECKSERRVARCFCRPQSAFWPLAPHWPPILFQTSRALMTIAATSSVRLKTWATVLRRA